MRVRIKFYEYPYSINRLLTPVWQTAVTVAGFSSKNNFHFMQFSLAGVEDRLRSKPTVLVLLIFLIDPIRKVFTTGYCT